MMADYVILINYTQKGVEGIKESPARLDKARETFAAMGGELKEYYLSMGRYDAVCIASAPDEVTAAKLALIIGSAGSVRTETMRVFPEAEFREMVASLP